MWQELQDNLGVKASVKQGRQTHCFRLAIWKERKGENDRVIYVKDSEMKGLLSGVKSKTTWDEMLRMDLESKALRDKLHIVVRVSGLSPGDTG